MDIFIKHVQKQFFLLEICGFPFFYVRHSHNFFNVFIYAKGSEFFHKIVVAYGKIPEPAQTGSWIHNETQKHPA